MVKTSWDDAGWIYIHKLRYDYLIFTSRFRVSLCLLHTLCSWYIDLGEGELVSSQ